MKKNELIKLRELVNLEVKRRERIKELLKSDLIKEYLEITKSEITELDSNNIQEILNQILSSFTIAKTNGIYVCTRSWRPEVKGNVNIDSKFAEYRLYIDIESGKEIIASRRECNTYGRPLIVNFEISNIVLNPYNTNKNKNGFEEVKMNFFESAIKDGQAKAKKLVLSKYARL